MSTAEFSLLESRWRLPLHENLSPAQDLARRAVEGRYIEVLTSETCRSLQLFHVVDDNVTIRWPETLSAETELVLLSVAVALLQSFLQINWTGPELHCDTAHLLASDVDGASLDAAAIEQLALRGEPAYHLTRHATFFLLAKKLFDDVRWKMSDTLPIWRLRAALVHLRLLDEPVPIDEDILTAAEVCVQTLLLHEPDLAAGSIVTLGQYYALASRSIPLSDRKASTLFHEAATKSGFDYELTGRLGKRTRFQTKETSQLVVLARSRTRHYWQPTGREISTELDGHVNGAASQGPQTLALDDDTLLEKTAFTASSSRSDNVSLADVLPDAQMPLHPLDQCILLALSLHIDNASPSHGLTNHQIGAFVARVLDDVGNWSVHSMALLMRSRLDASRSRTVERGLLQMQSLVDQMKLSTLADQSPEASNERGASVQERLAYIPYLALPARWALEAELARRYRGLGVVRSALEIYERLELWEDAALCHAATGRRDRAINLITDLIEGRKIDAEAATPAARRAVPDRTRIAKLWCILGDLENEPAHYLKALDLCGGSSSRALRALGSHQFKMGDFEKARDSLRQALSINPLFFETWFLLGCAALQASDMACAEESFGRCVALNDEDGESWSNLASVHLRLAEQLSSKGDSDAAFDRKRAAHTCLRQATRHAYESWRIWQNYLTSSLALGEVLDAAQALNRVIELRAAQHGIEEADLEALEMLVDAAVGRTVVQDTVSEAIQRSLRPRLQDLFDRALLPAISDNARVYRARARFLLGAGDARGSLAAHLAAYRCGPAQSSAVENDRKTFLAACESVRDTIDALETLGGREEAGQMVASDWRYQARTIVRSFLGRTKDAFESEAAYEALRDTLQDLR